MDEIEHTEFVDEDPTMPISYRFEEERLTWYGRLEELLESLPEVDAVDAMLVIG